MDKELELKQEQLIDMQAEYINKQLEIIGKSIESVNSANKDGFRKFKIAAICVTIMICVFMICLFFSDGSVNNTNINQKRIEGGKECSKR